MEHIEPLPVWAADGKGHAFELNWHGTIYKDYGNGSLNASVIWDAIHSFSPEYDDYIILEPALAINPSVSMQSHSPADDGIISVEIRFDYEDGSYKQYLYKSKDKKEVYGFFTNYWSKNEFPNLSNWTDITQKLENKKREDN